MRRRLGAVVVLVAVALASTATPASTLMSPHSVAAGRASPIPLGTYPGSIDLGGIANDLVFSSDRALAYATTREGVQVLRTSDWSIVDTIDTPHFAFGAALLDDETRLAVALHRLDEVIELDLDTGQIVATHEIETPVDVEATDDGNLLVSSEKFLSNAWIVDRGAEPPTVTASAELRVMIGAITPDPGQSSMYVVALDFSFRNIVQRLDSSTSAVSILATSAPLDISPQPLSSMVVDHTAERLYTASGAILDSETLTPIDEITPGVPVLAGDEIFMISSAEIAVHDRDTLELERSWEPACDAYPEGLVGHDAWLSPDGANLIVPSSTGLCLEPVDGSGPHPANLVFRASTIDGARISSGTLIVLDLLGRPVIDIDFDLWDRELDVWLLEGDYWVALVRPVDSQGWPLVPMTPNGYAILEREADTMRIEGRTVAEVITRPFPYDIVETSQTFWSSIQWLVMTGITQGCGPEAFCPNDYVTRGQMAAFIDRALELPDAGPAGFNDDSGSFQQNIWNLKAADITTGCARNRYCTDDYVTRGEMAAFIDRALELPDAGPAGFNDDGGIFQQNIWNLKAAGITTGCAHDRFCTDDYVTRAQMAAFLERALGDDWPFV